MSAPAPTNCKLIGRWRIVGAGIWDRDYLDVCGPATITDHGRGEIAFGALQAGSTSNTAAHRSGSRGRVRRNGRSLDDGSAKLNDDGSIEIEFAYHNGDEAVLKAKRATSSTACEFRARVRLMSTPFDFDSVWIPESGLI
jgi:hypothetical protein